MNWRPVTVGFFLVLAGCNAVPAPGGSGVAETVTPAPVPTDVPARGAGAAASMPPGLAPGGITDVDALARAHEEALHGRSYVYAERRFVERDRTHQSGMWVLHTERIVLEDGATFERSVTNRWKRAEDESPTRSRQVVYADGTDEYTYTEPDGEIERVPATDERDDLDVVGAAFLREHLVDGPARIEARDADGKRYYRVVVRDRAPASVDERLDYTAVMLVEPSGLVRRFSTRYRVPTHEGDRWVTAAFEYPRTDDVTVSRPDWLPANETEPRTPNRSSR